MNYAVILGNLGNTCDRFLSTGYKEQIPKVEAFRQAASIEGVSGIELVGSWDITTQNVGEVKTLLRDNGLKLASIIPDHFSQKRWGKGAFTSRDPEIRRQAISETKDMMDAAVELGGDLVNLWPGQDGYDYPFQGNFDEAWNWLVEGVRECATYRKDVRLALEYKPKEPRTHSFMAR
ncbi:MAG TPA: TIM barrel protein, partial [Anaerolineae bacterium]